MEEEEGLLSPEKDLQSIWDAKERWEAATLWRARQPETSILKPQVVVMEDLPVADKLVGPTDDLFYKPRGGLWTSTLNDEGGEWLRWLTLENYTLDMKRWGGKLWRLQPTEARVFIAWSPKHLYELAARYPHPERQKVDRLRSFRVLIDWPRMAEDWDAVHVPNPWPWRWHSDMAASMFFYLMDAECTCWFRWCFAGEPEELDPEPFLKKLKENS